MTIGQVIGSVSLGKELRRKLPKPQASRMFRARLWRTNFNQTWRVLRHCRFYQQCKVSCRWTRWFKFPQESTIACSHRKANSSTLHCTVDAVPTCVCQYFWCLAIESASYRPHTVTGCRMWFIVNTAVHASGDVTNEHRRREQSVTQQLSPSKVTANYR